MSLGRVPDSIEQNILDNLPYTTNPEETPLSEFEIHKYIQSLEAKKRKSLLSPEEYASLFRAYYFTCNNKLHDILVESYNHYNKNMLVHSEATLCQESGSANGLFYNPQFDLRDYWFNGELNPGHVPFRAFMFQKSSYYAGELVELRKKIRIEFILFYSNDVELIAGPFQVAINYETFKSNKSELLSLLIDKYVQLMREHKDTNEIRSFFTEFLYTNTLEKLDRIAHEKLSYAGIESIETANREIAEGEYESYGSVEDLINSL